MAKPNAGKPKLAAVAASADKRITKRETTKTQYSPRSNFPNSSQRRLTANMDVEMFEKLKMAAIQKGKPAGVILDELVEGYLHKIKARPRMTSDQM
jgi:hypothetical protein|tara:strand:- start:166 stop:453 length:288 start_codon:yes stop_codon:yes gene_type:complete